MPSDLGDRDLADGQAACRNVDVGLAIFREPSLSLVSVLEIEGRSSRLGLCRHQGRRLSHSMRWMPLLLAGACVLVFVEVHF